MQPRGKQAVAWSVAIFAALVALAIGQIEVVEVEGLTEWRSEAMREHCLNAAVAAYDISKDWFFPVSSFCLYRVPGFILDLQRLPGAVLIGVPVMLAAFLVFWAGAVVVAFPFVLIQEAWDKVRRYRRALPRDH